MENLVHARLPALPPSLADRRPLIVGAGARLLCGGPPIHAPPEVWVEAPSTVPGVIPDPTRPGRLRLGAWRVRPRPADVTAALAAREIAVDALGVEADGTRVDPLGGADALARGVIGPLGAAAVEADPALLLRAPALASELGLRLDEATMATLRGAAALALRADRDAIREALTQLLVGRRPGDGLEILARTGLLAIVLPEAAALIDFHRSSRFHHKDVWAHTVQVVVQAVPRPEIRWAALLHDIGKVNTRSYAPGKKVHFFRHDELGAYQFEGIAARLRFPAALAERIRLLVLYHLRANLYVRGWSDSAIRRFAAEIGPVLDDLLALSRADVTSKRPGRRREAMANLYDLKTRIAAVKAQDAARRHTVPKGLGTVIIERLGVAPGPRIAALREACEAAIRDGRLPAEPDVEACIEFLRAQVAA